MHLLARLSRNPVLTSHFLCSKPFMWFAVSMEKAQVLGVPVVAQQVTNLTHIPRMWVPSLALLSGLRIQHCHELWCSGLELVWLWCRLAAAALI